MCRLLCYVCPAEAPAQAAADVLPAFTAMSAEHKDGWGIAWHSPEGIRTIREPATAMHSSRYAEAVKAVATDAALLHLRLASPGIPVAEVNSHPFLRDGMAFGHNGFVGPVETVDTLIGPGLEPEGTTDSERYFLAVLSRVRDGAGAGEALLKTALDLVALSDTSSANAVLLTDDALHVVCAYRPGSQPPGRPSDYFALRYRADPDAVVVASTGVARDGWTDLPNRSVLSVVRATRECTVASG